MAPASSISRIRFRVSTTCLLSLDFTIPPGDLVEQSIVTESREISYNPAHQEVGTFKGGGSGPTCKDRCGLEHRPGSPRRFDRSGIPAFLRRVSRSGAC